MGCYAEQRHQKSCASRRIKFVLIGVIVSIFFQGVLSEVEPTESQCRPYIEKALKEQQTEAEERTFEAAINNNLQNEQEELSWTDEITDSTESSIPNNEGITNDHNYDDADEKKENEDNGDENEDKTEENNDDITTEQQDEDDDDDDDEDEVRNKNDNDERAENSASETEETEINEFDLKEEYENHKKENNEDQDTYSEKLDKEVDSKGEDDTNDDEKKENEADGTLNKDDSILEHLIEIETEDIELYNDDKDEDITDIQLEHQKGNEDQEPYNKKEEETDYNSSKEGRDDQDEIEDKHDGYTHENNLSDFEKTTNDLTKNEDEDDEKEDQDDKEQNSDDKRDTKEVNKKINKTDALKREETAESEAEEEKTEEEKVEEDGDQAPEEELTKQVVIPENLRSRNHIDKILSLKDSALETLLEKTIESTLKTLKTLYDNAIKPLEMLYKYRDLSNRHFGDPEIFSKPLILFMGPWSGGKSSTINYLLDNEFSHTSLRTGAEPSPAYFNILMHGEEEEILDGTQLAADWTFSGLQKFGQSLLDRLKGIKMPNKLLEKVNIVEIPGILEIRKQVQRLFPFNDACQWFIDRADIIFLVYDPSKLDVGPETEAILDQLKGREYQTKIILNKADQVKPEELMRVQGTLIWNISPLMSSSEPPIIYSTSLWSLPYEVGAPTRLLQAQERAFLKDLREAIDKRVENKIASARRFAVRVRNHAKMVDCYLTTYYNHKTIFGNRKKISDDIIEYPQKYHIYEGLSTLTNISRYDLPDPDAYKDFFKINPLYEFKKLSETCTYFRGCPINKLDVAIAYDLPELVGIYRKAVDAAKEQLTKENS